MSFTPGPAPPELGYNVICRDRKTDAHGGVLIAAKTTLGLSHLKSGKDTELISGSININQKKKAIITCLYRPPNRLDQQTANNAIQDITDLPKKHKSSIFILGGDFNLPDIDWKNYTIQGTQTSRDINNAFLEMAANLNIQQLVDKPTRGDNTLDVLFTSHPGQLNRCKTIPPLGNSDHDIVLLDFSHGLQKPKQQKRKIYLWKKANIAMINQHLKEKYNIFKNTDFEDVNSLWTNIKGLILDAINQHVPTRNTLTKHSHPWMNSELRRLSNKKQRAYTLAKSSGKTRDKKKYKFLKAQLQKEARQAHSNYMEDIVSNDLEKNPKRFWSYVKSRKQDASQIVTLKSKDGFLHSDTDTKASILNQQFQKEIQRSLEEDLWKSQFDQFCTSI
ncbi:unnamed protein product [Mytilus edulis]|uniref:Endonuclease/exonuclease/phosphatase domain-containing protein n=1 Tax=Mytilus edulis TaxID=6550 RepID=A0A8S3RRL9_MYTED|nr:unnamed protein product [Mytilus edulis]